MNDHDPIELAKDYEALPAFVRARFTLKEWMWMSDARKAELVRQETEPDHAEP